MWSTSGRSSRSTLTFTKWRFISAGDVGILERLALHHVTPVAGGVADRQQQRLVLGAGPGERLLAPRIPVDRVVGVLEQVRAGLVGEAVVLTDLLTVRGQRANGSALTVAGTTSAVRRGPPTAVPGSACWRRTKASAIGRCEAERPRGARDARRSRRRRRRPRRPRGGTASPVEHEAAQVAVDVAAIADAHDDLLAGIATLGVGDAAARTAPRAGARPGRCRWPKRGVPASMRSDSSAVGADRAGAGRRAAASRRARRRRPARTIQHLRLARLAAAARRAAPRCRRAWRPRATTARPAVGAPVSALGERRAPRGRRA